MVTLKLSLPPTQKNPVLTERGDGYEQLWHFRSVGEINHRLENLDLLPWQLEQLWAGNEVELTDWESWPHRMPAESDAAPPARKHSPHH